MQIAWCYRRDSFHIVCLPFPLFHLHIILRKEKGEISDIYFLYHIPISFSIHMRQNEAGNNYQERFLLCYEI